MEIENKPMTFQEWLLKCYGITPLQQKDLCRRTGRASDYHQVMEWYRRRYRLEQETREALIRANPFLSETLIKTNLSNTED